MSANLVAVTACPTGIAHSQMGAEGLERAAADAGHDIRVEVQGAFGVEDDLTDADLEWADAAIVAADVRVDIARFRDADLPVVEIPVSDAVTDPETVVERAHEAAETDTTAASGGTRSDDAEPKLRAGRSFVERLRQLL